MTALPHSSNPTVPVHWRQLMLQNFTRWEPLADFLELDAFHREQISPDPHFTLSLPLRLAEKISKNNLDDPILRQFVPLKQETLVNKKFISDPVGDQYVRKNNSRVLHKYQGRALILCTSACAMHCRYCFRQNFDYTQTQTLFEEEIQLIQADSSITEVILSGGDPLALSDYKLRHLLQGVANIPHVKRIRFHSRFPIGIPERIDPSFLEILKEVPKQVWFVVHVNHPRELDEDVLKSLRAIQKLAIPVLNQAVLLRGVNDDLETLKLLSELLVDNGISPYYLHQLDRVQGAAHFEVTEEEGIKLIQALTQRLSGYAVPKYVREISGESSKTFILPYAPQCG